jgi:hypothetical protein
MRHNSLKWHVPLYHQEDGMIVPIMTLAAKPVAHLLQATGNYPGQMTPDQQFEIAREAIRHGGGPAGLLVPLSFFAMVVLIVWLGVRRKQAQILAHAELTKRVLDKFGSAQELAAFLESKGGQQFLGDARWQAKGQLRFLPGGVITTMLGLAFLGLTFMHRNFIVPGVLLLAVGIGLLISAAIAHKLTSKINDESIHPSSGAQSFPPA